MNEDVYITHLDQFHSSHIWMVDAGVGGNGAGGGGGVGPGGGGGGGVGE